MSMDFEDLCIHPGGVLPPNFLMLNVEKYDGTTYTRMHLCMYYSAMFQWGHDDSILVQMFGQSLENNVGKWLASLDMVILNHYRFDLEMLPTKEKVEGMRPFTR